ncbi:dienelactone hydrolase [Schizothecium vesticola]|uniref:Dienelactone hydrolase n=1 Tax=Schizothecium vesticola TaxID=314040 RepID=A0AA40EU86_9PEZI|nr:dienelactone hydrolase [Schizothecium vesticola]
MRASILASLVSALLASTSVAHSDCTAVDNAIIQHEGISKGVEEVQSGIRLYVSKPETGSIRGKANADTAIIYLSDVFGIELLQNRLLADSFARAGYLTVAPDLFNNAHATGDINVPGFNTSAFVAAHGPEVTDPIVAKTIDHLRTKLGVKKIGLTGYCFGGRYAFRFVSAGKGGDAAFTAHPSLLGDDEVKAVVGPVAIAAAETDSMLNAPRRGEVEKLLVGAKVPYQVSLYSGTSHGFGVRANVSVPVQKFGKEEAFLQAVRWFDQWL